MASWLWGSSSSSDDTSSVDRGGGRGHDSHLELHHDDPQQSQTEDRSPPLYMLDQLKHAGVPLKAQINPYLQLDPSIFRESQPKIILPEGYEGGRGKFEFYMGYIGCAVGGAFFTGYLRGTIGEFFNPQTQKLIGQTKTLKSTNAWRTRILNGGTKYGSGYAQSAGTAMLLYCVSELAIKQARGRLFGSGDDLLNSFAGAGIAGALYRAPHGLRASGLGAAVALGIMAAWTAIDADSRRSVMEMWRNININT